VKLFSLLSAAALTTIVAVSGFCDEQQVDYQTAPESSQGILAHDPNQPDDHPSGVDQAHDQRLRRIERMHGDSGPPPPPADVVINSPHGCMEHGFSLEAEFLWWRANIDNLEYGLQGNQTLAGASTGTVSIRTKEPDYQFDPGVRVSAGYDFGRRNWDLFVRWTYHYTDPTDSAGSENPSFSILAFQVQAAPQANFNAVVLADRASVEWTNRLNAFDLEMGYDYFFSRRFSIRPHFGLKAAWIDMHYHAKYSNVLIAGNPNTPYPELSVRNRSDYWGVGPRVGIDGHLHIGWGFSLYGMTSAAMLYGRFDTKLKLIDPDLTVVVNHDFYRLRATGQIAAGLRWGWCFSRKYFLSLHLGWETQYWWEQLEMRFFERYEPGADLSFSGLDAGIRFDF